MAQRSKAGEAPFSWWKKSRERDMMGSKQLGRKAKALVLSACYHLDGCN